MSSEIGPEQKRLTERLFGDPNRQTRNFNIFPGERRCTPEELCREINSALDQIENGTAEMVEYPPDSEVEPIDVLEFVAKMDQESR
jgi:hypothetical protein